MKNSRIVSILMYTELKYGSLLYGVSVNWVKDTEDGLYRGSSITRYKSIETATSRLAWLANGVHNNPERQCKVSDIC
jgi:hypothetical protein